MKTLAKYIISLFILLQFYNCSTQIKNCNFNKNKIFETDSLFELVVSKLSQDTLSFETCNNLHTIYINNLNLKDSTFDNFNNYYFRQYNKGNSFIRLINKDKLGTIFHKQYYNDNNLFISWSEYIEIVKNYNNYNTDNDIGGENGQRFNFYEYIKKGIILPKSH